MVLFINGVKNLNLFKITYEVFKDNFKELKKVLEKHDKIKLNELLKTESGKKKFNRIQRKITQQLHNYLSSAYSLNKISISRKNRFEKAGILFEYEEKVNEYFKENDIAIFIKDLRAFTQHYKIPQISTRTSFSRSGDNNFDIKTSLFINSSYLEGFDWKPVSKRIIKSHSKGIDIKKYLSDYFNLATDFHNWFVSQQQKILHEDIKYVKSMEKEIRQRSLLFSIKNFFRQEEIGKRDNFEKMIFNFISIHFLNKINGVSIQHLLLYH
ncbi:MAG: hypothetical protein GH151_15375 [Bacteroidetes bacterium]|nr:hypothetical protein [Bacteroidota bacterium]